MQKKTLRYSMLLMLVVVLSLSLVAPASAKVGRYIDVQILAINDFHGALDQYSTATIDGNKVPIGGAEYLATHIKEARATNPNTIFVGGGDLIGASPLLSSLFHDEPTELALSQMGMEYSVVGNHEFDEGVQELLRMQYGGCNLIDGCLMGDYPGASFKYLAANVIRDDTGKTLFPPYAIKNYNGARIGFIGVDYENTPSIVTAAGTQGVKFLPELETINKYAKILRKDFGVRSIVVLLHDGFNNAGECTNPDSSFYKLVSAIDPEVDVVISGHSHQYYTCDVAGKLVTSAYYNGRGYTDINLTIDKGGDQVVKKSGEFKWNTDDVTPDQGIVDLIAKYKAVADPIANAPVGYISADITRTANAAGESALGDVIADGQLANTAPSGAVIAMTNPGGIRADLFFKSSAVGEGDGVVTYGEAFSVQPFSNYMVLMDLTGAQLKAVLEQQATTNRILQISNGFTYTWTASAAADNHVSNMALNGTPMDMGATYRVAVNNFLAGGGDGFTNLTVGTNQVIGAFDIDAFVAYLKTSTQASPIVPGPQNRITKVP